MRFIFLILTVIAFLFSGLIFATVFLFGGLGGCHSGDPCSTEMSVYIWSSLTMIILSLMGLIGMVKSMNDYNSQQFNMFVIIGFFIPLFIYFFVGDYSKDKNKENSYENDMNKYYQEHCLNMPNGDGTRYWSCDDGRTYQVK